MQTYSSIELVKELGQSKISDIVRLLLKYESPKKRKTTQEQYRIYLCEISREIGHFKVDDFGILFFEEWLHDFKNRKNRTTFNDYSKYLNKIYGYAYNLRLASHRIIFPMLDEKRGKVGRIYTEAETELLFSFMNPDLRDQHIIATDCYMRKMEILCLDETMIDFDRECFVLRPEHVKTGSRTGLGRTIPWTPRVKEIVFRRFNPSRSKFLFPGRFGEGHLKNNKTAWRLARARAGIAGRARWHDWRGTALTRAVHENRLAIAGVAAVAGLSVPTLQRVYAQPDVEQLRDFVGFDILKKTS